MAEDKKDVNDEWENEGIKYLWMNDHISLFYRKQTQ